MEELCTPPSSGVHNSFLLPRKGELSEGDEVETIREKIGDWRIDEGQYRFNIKGKIVYALWGVGPLPPEITGEVKVTEISGAQRVADSATLKLSDSPIFIELMR